MVKKMKKKNTKKFIAKKLINDITKIREGLAPEGANCPKCNTRLVYTYQLMFAFPAAVKCPKCCWTDNWWNYIGKKLVTVEPLPKGALGSIFVDKDVK